MASSNIVWGPGSAVRPGSAFEILPDQPLEALRLPYAAAFACVRNERPDENFVAVLADLFATEPGRFARLSDLADVRDSVGEIRTIARLNGRPATTFAVNKTKGSSDVAVYEV